MKRLNFNSHKFTFAQAIFTATIAYKALQDEENASGSNGGGSSRGFTDAAKAYSLTLAVSGLRWMDAVSVSVLFSLCFYWQFKRYRRPQPEI